MIRAIAVDIDNTLVPAGTDMVVPSALQALHACQRSGIKVIIATGRCYCLIQPDVKDNLRPDGYVTINGACLNRADGSIMDSYPFDVGMLERLTQECRSRHLAVGFKYNDTVAVQTYFDDYCHVYCKTPFVYQHVSDDTADHAIFASHGGSLGAFIIGPNQLAQDLAPLFAQASFVYAYPHGTEAYRCDLDKGRSLAKALAGLGMGLDECLAIGDSPNDIAMLKACGIGVAMGNADAQTKQAADHVTAPIDQDGLAAAVYEYCLKQR